MRFLFVDRAERISKAIGRLEGIAFGKWLEFAAVGDQLRINIQGEGRIEGFRNLPGLREFATNLNVAMRPVIDAYVATLRQELANECIRLANQALEKESK